MKKARSKSAAPAPKPIETRRANYRIRELEARVAELEERVTFREFRNMSPKDRDFFAYFLRRIPDLPRGTNLAAVACDGTTMRYGFVSVDELRRVAEIFRTWGQA